MTYLFVTDSDGNFQYGTAYFKESFSSPDLPVELLAEDFIILDDDRFLLAGKVDRYAQNNIFAYTPTLLEVSANTAAYDEGLHKMLKIREVEGEVFHRHRINDYPWGLDPLRFNVDEEKNEILLAYDNHLFRIDNLLAVSNMSTCLEAVPENRLHSFSFTLNFSDFELLGTSLISSPVSINSLSSRDVDPIENCSEVLVSVAETNIITEKPKLLTTMVDAVFDLQSPQSWLGSSILVINGSGQVVSENKIRDEITGIPVDHLSAGLYFIHIQNGA